MKKNNIPMIIIIILLICLSLGSTYAFLNIDLSKNTITGNAGCFVVEYIGEAGQYIRPSEKLTTSADYTSGGSSTVTLSKNSGCKIYTKANIYLYTNEQIINEDGTPSGTSNELLSENALKYTVVDANNNIVVDANTSQEASGSITTSGATKLTTVNLTETPTTYTIYIWIDNSITYQSQTIYDGLTYSGYIYADAQQESTYNG